MVDMNAESFAFTLIAGQAQLDMERSHCNDEMTCSGLLSGKSQLENRLPTYRKLS